MPTKQNKEHFPREGQPDRVPSPEEPSLWPSQAEKGGGNRSWDAAVMGSVEGYCTSRGLGSPSGMGSTTVTSIINKQNNTMEWGTVTKPDVLRIVCLFEGK